MLLPFILWYTVKPVLSCHLKIDKTKVLMKNGSLMNVESIAEHSAILLTCMKRWRVLKNIFSVRFEWLLKTGFTVNVIFHSKTLKCSIFHSIPWVSASWYHLDWCLVFFQLTRMGGVMLITVTVNWPVCWRMLLVVTVRQWWLLIYHQPVYTLRSPETH